MKILILGGFTSGALEHYYVTGLAAAGASTDLFDITKDYYGSLDSSLLNKCLNKIRPEIFFKPINTRLLQYVQGKNYDVILIFKGMTLFPETLKQLKQHTKILSCYNPDHPFRFFSEGSGNKQILNSIPLYDLYFTYATKITSELKRLYKVNAYTVPFGYDDNAVPSKMTQSSEMADKWLFIGSYDTERAAFLNRLNEQGLFIFGDTKWKTRTRFSAVIQKAYRGYALYDEAYKKAIATGLGVFNLLRKQNIEEGSHNMRTFEVPGYGGLLITNRTEEQLLFFEEDKEAIYFDTIDELRDKLRYLSQRPAEVAKIKQAAELRSRKSQYSYRCRSELLQSIIKEHL